MFGQGFTCPALLVPALVSPGRFRIRGCHPLRPAVPDRSPNAPVSCRWLFRVRSPLLTESRLISVPPGTEMFQFPGFAFRPYGFRTEYPRGWVAPFRDLRIQACWPAPRSFSQAAASFVACGRLGIHRMRLVAGPGNPQPCGDPPPGRAPSFTAAPGLAGPRATFIALSELLKNWRRATGPSHNPRASKAKAGETLEARAAVRAGWVVEPGGFEPPTPGLQSRRSPG